MATKDVKPVVEEPKKVEVVKEVEPEVKEEAKVEPAVEEKPVEVEETDKTFEPWTIDIRETLDEDVKESAVDALVEAARDEGKEVTQIYATDKQQEHFKKFKKYQNVTLTAH